MFTAAFSGFSVDNLGEAKEFYTNILGLQLIDESMGLTFQLPGDSGTVFMYEKPDHQPASYTTLNLVVTDIEDAVDQLVAKGLVFERYTYDNFSTDDKGIAWGKKAGMGPNIAWFKDPASNTLAVLEN